MIYTEENTKPCKDGWYYGVDRETKEAVRTRNIATLNDWLQMRYFHRVAVHFKPTMCEIRVLRKAQRGQLVRAC